MEKVELYLVKRGMVNALSESYGKVYHMDISFFLSPEVSVLVDNQHRYMKQAVQTFTFIRRGEVCGVKCVLGTSYSKR